MAGEAPPSLIASLGPAPPDVPPTEDKGLKDRTFPMTESAGFVAGEEASGNAFVRRDFLQKVLQSFKPHWICKEELRCEITS